MLRIRRTAFAAAILVLAAAGCNEAATGPDIDWNAWPYGFVTVPAGVVITAEFERSAESPNRGVTTMVATNTGSAPAILRYNDCAFGVRVYEDQQFVGDPSYHNVQPVTTTCATVTRQQTIAPGSSFTRQVSDMNLPLLGQTIGEGTYYVALTYRTAAAGPILTVPAGTVVLE